MKLLSTNKVQRLLPAHCLTLTHEQFIKSIAESAISRVADEPTRIRLRSAKLTYGVGDPGTRGVTYFQAWQNSEPKPQDFVTICAGGEESPVQLAGTTVHELGHVLAGTLAGHGKDWKAACEVLGLQHAEPAGQCYSPEHFSPDILSKIKSLITPTDGRPVFGNYGGNPFQGLPIATKFKPCPLGIGTKGGKSRGKGSGSRLRLYTCDCNPSVKVRVSSDNFAAHCDVCNSAFNRTGK